MTVKEFNTAGYREKTEAALKGTFLVARLTHRHYIKLYNVEHFYVEVFFDDRNHLITHFKAFDQTSLVLPYLEDLQVAV